MYAEMIQKCVSEERGVIMAVLWKCVVDMIICRRVFGYCDCVFDYKFIYSRDNLFTSIGNKICKKTVGEGRIVFKTFPA